MRPFYVLFKWLRVLNRCFKEMHTCCSSISQLLCCNCHGLFCTIIMKNYVPTGNSNIHCLAQFEGNLVVIIGPVFLLSLEKGNHHNWEDLDEKASGQTPLSKKHNMVVSVGSWAHTCSYTLTHLHNIKPKNLELLNYLNRNGEVEKSKE